VKYLLRLSIETTLKNLIYEQEFAVVNPVDRSRLSEENKPIKLEVGIDEWLHLIFEMDQRNFGLKDICTGKVTFKKANIKLKSMEIQIIKKEIINVTGVAPETSVITKYEIMDGGPVKNETVPIRFFLKPYSLTPSMINVNNKFSVQYFINLVLSDDVDRKYFKQHEINLFRLKKEKKVQAQAKETLQSICNSSQSKKVPAIPLPTSLQNGWRKTNETFSFCFSNFRLAPCLHLLFRR
jgi:vacuolar protein sorting-associated protein 26